MVYSIHHSSFLYNRFKKLNLCKVDKTGTITESGVTISSMMTYINKWPHIRWLLTVANDGANSIFKALRDNTDGAQDTFCSRSCFSDSTANITKWSISFFTPECVFPSSAD